MARAQGGYGGRGRSHAATSVAVAVAVAALGWALPAQAMDYVWFGGTGSFDAAGNWVPNGVPGPLDTATINIGTIQLLNDRTVGGFSWLGGSVDFRASLTASNGLNLHGSNTKILGFSGGSLPTGLVNNGAGTWSGTGGFSNWANGRFTNGSTGTFDIQTDADFIGGTFINQGALTKSFGVGVSNKTEVRANLTNSGSVNVQQGVLAFTDGGQHSGSFSTGVNGWVEFAGGNINTTHSLLAGSSVTGNVRHISSFGPTLVNIGASYNTTRTEMTTGGSFEVATGASASTATLGILGGRFQGGGNLTASGLVTFGDGDIGGFGGQVIANGGLSIEGSAPKTLGANNGTTSSGLVNNGAGTWSGTGGFSNWANGRFTNGLSGSFDIQTDADFIGGTFINQGALTKSAGVGVSNKTEVRANLSNSGSIHVEQGVLAFTDGGQHSGSFSTGANGWLEFAGGNINTTHSLLAGSSVTGNVRHISSFGPMIVNIGASYNTTRTEITAGGIFEVATGASASTATFGMLGGRYQGGGDLVVNGPMVFSAGQIGGFGGQVIANGGLSIEGSAAKTLGANNGTTSSGLVNNGAGTWSGAGNISNWANGRFTNGSTGSFDIQTDADFVNGTFINQGALIKSAGVGASNKTVVSANLSNSGSIHVEQGVLAFTDGGQHSGSFSTGANGWLEFAGGNINTTHSLLAGSSVTGNVRHISSFGPMIVNIGASYNTTRTEITAGGIFEVATGASASTATFGMQGGRYQGGGNFSASGLMTFSGGQIGGFGGQVIANGGLSIEGSASKALGANNGTTSSGLVNNGAATWSGTGGFSNWATGRFTNSGTGTFDIQTDADFAGGTFINQGTVVKSAGVGGTERTQITGSFINTGLTRVQQGTLEVGTAFNNQGVIDVQAGARFAGTGAFTNSGTIRGNGTVAVAATQVLANQGLIAPGDGVGTLTLDGDLQMATGGRLQFELASTTSFDTLVITDDAGFAGTIEVANAGYVPSWGDSFVVITYDQRLNSALFSALDVQGFAAGVSFEVLYQPGQVILSVVPEPGAWAMWIAGLAAMGGLARRRA